MTAAALKVKLTPMGPYIDLMQDMTREQKMIVVSFLTESMQEPETAKSKGEIIREKYKNLEISPEIKRLRGCIKLTDEDLKDERVKYILDK
ncbi:MAG: hypothetical protein J6U04_10005 [Salinivirgaceae bacterium]|nr:hypothetical protein [Salinivirgaceae bacterium]